MKPTFIGLGAQKCASTWVHHVLNDHPDAQVSSPKELDYFSYYYGRGYYWYEQFFDEMSSKKKAIGENSPSYLPHPLAPERAALYNPDFKIIVALRDPIERAYSNHLHMVMLGYLKGPDMSFEYGLKNNHMYIEQSRYGKHLRNWMNHFPKEAFHVVLQEEVKDHGAEEARKLYKHLSIDETFTSAASTGRFNESRTQSSSAIRNKLRAYARTAKKMGMGSLIQQVNALEFVKNMKRSGTKDLREIVPPMKDETRARLTELLLPEVEELQKILGRDKLPWKITKNP